tara:strand:- start:513 stop:869 length:357 start_codon:yes stop_codon:yes gene_type:complete
MIDEDAEYEKYAGQIDTSLANTDGHTTLEDEIDELTRMFIEREMPEPEVKDMLDFVAEMIADDSADSDGIAALLYYNYTAPPGVRAAGRPDLMKNYLKKYIKRYVYFRKHNLNSFIIN